MTARIRHILVLLAWIPLLKGELFFIKLYTSTTAQYPGSVNSPYLTLHGTTDTESGIKIWEDGFETTPGMVTELLVLTTKSVGHVTNITLHNGGDDGYVMKQISMTNTATRETCHVICNLYCGVEMAPSSWPKSVTRDTSDCNTVSPMIKVNGEIDQVFFKSLPILHPMVTAIDSSVIMRRCDASGCAQACLATPGCQAFTVDTSNEAPHCCPMFALPLNTGVRFEAGMSPLMFVKCG